MRILVALGLSIGIHFVFGIVFGEGGDDFRAGVMPSQERLSNAIAARILEPVKAETRLTPHDPHYQDHPDHIDTPVPPLLRTGGRDSVIPVLTSSEPYYFSSQELTAQPLVLQDVQPSQNPVFSNLTVQTVNLRLLVNESGDVDQVLIEDPNLPEEAARVMAEEFSKVKFLPGAIDATPVKSRLDIEVTLDIVPLNRTPVESGVNNWH